MDREKRRLSLSIKSTIPNPWENLDQKLEKGDQLQAVGQTFRELRCFCRYWQ